MSCHSKTCYPVASFVTIMNSKQRQEFLIRQLPSEVKNSLARCLDRHAENDWQMLAEHLNFSQSDIQAMERDMLGPDPISATIALLNEWQTVDPMAKVDKLFIQLGRIEKKDAMILLIPYGTLLKEKGFSLASAVYCTTVYIVVYCTTVYIVVYCTTVYIVVSRPTTYSVDVFVIDFV